MGGNEIERMPVGLSALGDLEVLLLNRNRIEAIPEVSTRSPLNGVEWDRAGRSGAGRGGGGGGI